MDVDSISGQDQEDEFEDSVQRFFWIISVSFLQAMSAMVTINHHNRSDWLDSVHFQIDVVEVSQAIEGVRKIGPHYPNKSHGKQTSHKRIVQRLYSRLL